MSDTVDTVVSIGVGIVVVVVLALAGTSVMSQATQTEVLSIDNSTEWNNYANTLTGVQVNGSYIELQPANTTGTYDSVTLTGNESNGTIYEIEAEVPSPDNSTVNFTANGETTTLEDGANTVEFNSSVSNFTFDFERDSTSVSTPRVDYVTGSSTDGDGGILGLVSSAAFAILLLLLLVKGFQEREGMSL